jgi:peptidoglycan L-alanyl-D-glutamate endopeptidase CwlK
MSNLVNINYLTPLSDRRLLGVEPLLCQIVRAAIQHCPYEFQIAWMGGVRDATEQKALYDDGKSKCDGVIKLSLHQKGMAFDIICYDENRVLSWDVDIFTEVANWIRHVAETQFNTELEWGGDWKRFKDRPHFQLNK